MRYRGLDQVFGRGDPSQEGKVRMVVEWNIRRSGLCIHALKTWSKLYRQGTPTLEILTLFVVDKSKIHPASRNKIIDFCSMVCKN
jgi:hypothetical protein